MLSHVIKWGAVDWERDLAWFCVERALISFLNS